MKKMVYTLLSLCSIVCAAGQLNAQTRLTPPIAFKLSQLPLRCIPVEFPNKTSHLSDGVGDAKLLPSELHPVFYGCLDWHSSVHGHWMLVRLLQEYADLPDRDIIIKILNNSFQREKKKKKMGNRRQATLENIRLPIPTNVPMAGLGCSNWTKPWLKEKTRSFTNGMRPCSHLPKKL